MRGGDIVCGWVDCNKTDGSVSKLKEHLRCKSIKNMISIKKLKLFPPSGVIRKKDLLDAQHVAGFLPTG